MTYDANCIFCKIIKGEVPCFKVWEDEKHLAFLTSWPNTEGFTVLVTKAHYPSYAFDLPDHVLTELVLAAKTLGKIIDKSFDTVGRTGMVFEGFGVNHIHAKLIPMHGTKSDEWKQINSNIKTYFDMYPGYLSSHNAEKQPDEVLQKTAAKIRAAQKK